jgi:MSHA pilin protein MshD
MCVRKGATRDAAHGFTLIEIIVLIVVVSAALVGVLLVFQTTVRGSADPQVQKQAVAIAEALLDEILLTSYDPLPGTGARANFDDVADYAGYTTAGGMVDIQGAPVAGLGAYNIANVTVGAVPLNDVGNTLTAVAETLRVTVTVSGPNGVSISLDGYRSRYAAP